jgi:hypothetical protein
VTGNATVSTGKSTRAAKNSAYVRSLLKVREPRFAAALESVVADLMRDRDQPARSVR